MNGPDKDPEYWQTYGVMIGPYTLHNLRTAAWPFLVDIEGNLHPTFVIYTPPRGTLGNSISKLPH